MHERRKGGIREITLLALSASLVAGLAFGCAANPGTGGSSRTLSDLEEQVETETSLPGARVSFHYSDYYSLTAPDTDTSCAGDVRRMYDVSTHPSQVTGYTGPSGTADWLPLDSDVTKPERTIRPSFIKNISVDMTDANAAVSSNQASSCSYGNGALAPPVSNCATFDYGAIGGIPTSMGGTMLLVGGIQSVNYAGHQGDYTFRGPAVSCGPILTDTLLSPPSGYTRCNASFYALGVQTLPAAVAKSPPDPLAPGITSATDSISSWANIGGVTGYSGPLGAAGASATYSESLQRMMIFGGSAPVDALDPIGPGVTTYDTWTYDLKVQKWTKQPGNPSIAPELLLHPDFDGVGPLINLVKGVVGRALFGYVPQTGVSLTAMNTTGATTNGIVDATESLMIVGGLTGTGALTSTHRFNPTYGPQWINTFDPLAPQSGAGPAVGDTVQWLDSYHTQITNNLDALTTLTPDFAPIGSVDTGFAMGVAAIRNNTAVGNAGYLLSAGGFKYGASRNLNLNNTCASATFSAAGALFCGKPTFIVAIISVTRRRRTIPWPPTETAWTIRGSLPDAGPISLKRASTFRIWAERLFCPAST